MSDLLIAVRNLSLNLPDRAARSPFAKAVPVPILQNLNFDVPRGSVVGVLGQAGAGKSALGRTLLRVFDPSAGTIIFDGQDITDMTRAIPSRSPTRAQMIFADPRQALNPRHTARALVAAPLLRHLPRAEAHTRADAAIEAVGLPANHAHLYPHQMSDSDLTRVGIARAIAPRPSFVVADAVGDGLDLSARARILALLEDLQRDLGLTLMVLSRDPSVIRLLSDRTLVLANGQIVEDAPTPALFARPSAPESRALIGAVPLPVSHQIW